MHSNKNNLMCVDDISESETLDSLSLITANSFSLTGEVQNNKNLLFAIVHHSSNAVVITDTKRRILYANKKFEDISGYKLEEVLWQNPRVLKSKKTPRSTYQDMNSSLSQGKDWHGEFINTHKDGTEYIEKATITIIRDNSGKSLYYLAEKTDITALKIAQKEIYSLAYYDTLTGLPNRTHFVEKLNEKIATIDDNYEVRFSVLFADLNRFKTINDTCGHLSGDMALREVARRFKSVIGGEDILARIGGDEFILVHDHTSGSCPSELARKLSDSLLEPLSIHGNDHHVGVSIGSASYPDDGVTLEQLLQFADIAMYEAKSSNRFYYAYKDATGSQSQRQFYITTRIEKAIDRNELYLVYQPKIDLKTKQIIGAEALLRWREPELGVVSPAEFIPIAERCGFMNDIGFWVIEQVCCQLKKWQESGVHLPGSLAVNLSIQQLDHSDFLPIITAILDRFDVYPKHIELEVTESMLMTNPQQTSEMLAMLAKCGFTISIDDFGTGYSSLAYLKDINASVLKIDKSFIEGVSSKTNAKTIVESIVQMAHNLGMTVVAEGVEDKLQVSFLKDIECDIAQGFFFSKPMNAQKFERYLSNLESK
ncbi:sensor domain-containing protein [Vibrio hangzhouensis]|uniref:PAS domain S-box-containing protein/diguanylate cyclase (GGDEF) domain-containing protein n=1 Tax=Vibrio hangzhouensis TaxID=462991 RepID=A0A1H6A7L6_9VIBR|nr:GGDEF domain-containing phosphodiesterase [Vibrio hangzhouensis]SEG44174.1 PAS domain S-box-containing protein/diguanylate cyclase (GGDEF) domain-containing protein [Vibrio hangzhouensis]